MSLGRPVCSVPRIAAEDAVAARAVLDRGGVLAIATESSWGLAVDPHDPAAVATIFAIKGRLETMPLPLVAADLDQIAALGVAGDDPGLTLASPWWPAALSVLVTLPAPIAATVGHRRAAVRIPARGELRRLLAGVGQALTATSANRSGTAPILAESELDALLAGWDAAVVVAGEPVPGGAPSTLVEPDRAGGRVLRAGRVPWPPTIPPPAP